VHGVFLCGLNFESVAPQPIILVAPFSPSHTLPPGTWAKFRFPFTSPPPRFPSPPLSSNFHITTPFACPSLLFPRPFLLSFRHDAVCRARCWHCQSAKPEVSFSPRHYSCVRLRGKLTEFFLQAQNRRETRRRLHRHARW
jgi:hypothetical protein